MTMNLRILHVLDHSIPLHSGYTFRTLSILREQRKLGWDTFHITSPKQGETSEPFEVVDGMRFYRTPVASGTLAALPIGKELALKLAPLLRGEPAPGHDPSTEHLARLLWREEALAQLEALGLSKGMKFKPKIVLFAALAEAMTADALSTYVRTCLKSRANWRLDAAPRVCDGSSRPVASA